MLSIPDEVINLVNWLGKCAHMEQYSNKLQILNKNKAKFDWNNDYFEEERFF